MQVDKSIEAEAFARVIVGVVTCIAAAVIAVQLGKLLASIMLSNF